MITAAAMLAACDSRENGFDATGIFEATEITVSALETGQIVRLDAEEGTLLKKGQQTGLIDTVQLALSAIRLGATKESIASSRPDIQTQIAATRQQIEKAEMEKLRFERLVRDNAANRKQLDDAEAQLAVLKKQLEAQLSTLERTNQGVSDEQRAAEAQIMQLEDQLRKCRVVSPAAGTVLAKYAEAGEVTAAGKPLFKLADLRHVFLRAYVSGSQLSEVKVGQSVKVYADEGEDGRREYAGRVTWISGQAEFTPKTIQTRDERANLVYAVKIAVENDGLLKLGMYGEVKFQ